MQAVERELPVVRSPVGAGMVVESVAHELARGRSGGHRDEKSRVFEARLLNLVAADVSRR